MNTNHTSAAAYLTILAGGRVPGFDITPLLAKKERGHRSAAAAARDRRKPNRQSRLKGYQKR